MGETDPTDINGEHVGPAVPVFSVRVRFQNVAIRRREGTGPRGRQRFAPFYVSRLLALCYRKRIVLPFALFSGTFVGLGMTPFSAIVWCVFTADERRPLLAEIALPS